MSRTHHATRTWRLSCGCLRDYPGMPLGKTHHLLCVACNKAVTTEYPYPDRTGAYPICGFQTSIRSGADVTHVCCTNAEGNADCGRGVHYDRMTQRKFETRSALRASNTGSTSRA